MSPELHVPVLWRRAWDRVHICEDLHGVVLGLACPVLASMITASPFLDGDEVGFPRQGRRTCP